MEDENGGVFDGLMYCGDCGMPMFTDGKGHYVHANQLAIGRLRKLMEDKGNAVAVLKWLSSLEVFCPDCKVIERPFKDLEEDAFCDRAKTKLGAKDLYQALGHIASPPSIHGG